jgi:hypothetical protein
MLTEIATYLQTAGCGTVGVDLFLGDLPDTPETCVALVEYGGLPPQRTFGAVAWEQQRVQIWIRSATYLTAREWAERIYRALLAIANTTLSGTLYFSAVPTPPAILERDEHERPILAIRVRVTKALSELPS